MRKKDRNNNNDKVDDDGKLFLYCRIKHDMTQLQQQQLYIY